MTQRELINFIWGIANKLRGPCRPPQYRRVMIPMTVLRRLDCVLESTKQAVLAEHALLKANKVDDATIEKAIKHKFDLTVFNTSRFTFAKLLGAPNDLAANLVAYLNGFSAQARDILARFEFDTEVQKLEEANALFEVVKAFAAIDLHPETVPNTAMGYVFEDLVRRFNEQANEEAGDHFTPREVIRLMVHVLFAPDDASAERIERLKDETAFKTLAERRKRKDKAGIAAAVAEGQRQQRALLEVLAALDASVLYKNRPAFAGVLDAALKALDFKPGAALRKAILAALSERDDSADICRDKNLPNGSPEPDPELRDTENVPLPDSLPLPAPLAYGRDADNTKLVAAVKDHCAAYVEREVLPHVPDAWVDHAKTRLGFEIPFNRHVYKYTPPRPLEAIEADLRALEGEIVALLGEVVR